MTDWLDVADRIEAQDARGVVRAFAGLTEAQRRALAPEAIAHYKRDHLNAVAGLAVLATGARGDAERLWVGVVAREADACVELLAERQPNWVEEWVDRLCERAPQSTWRLARGLRARGLYTGSSPAYALAFIAGIGAPAWQQRKPVYDQLLADRSLLDDELWRAFQIEGGGETSFAAHDKFISEEASWAASLQRLAADSHIDRQRLLDATLDALSRGYSAFRAGWFVRFHDRLAPTVEERRARLDQYLDLLGSPTAQVQSFAVKAIAVLDKADPIEGSRLVRALRPAVLNRAKGTASQALRLVDGAAGRAPEAQALAAQVGAEGLLHEAPDVQARAVAIVERYADAGGEDLAAALVSAAPVVAPSLRPKLEALAGPSAAAPAVDDAAPARTWPDSILEASVLDELEAVTPIETAADLAIAVARALEHPEETDGLERALDGISRLCAFAHLDSDSIWAPMRKRAGRHLGERRAFAGRGVATDFAALVAAWLDRRPPEPIDPPLTVMGFCSVRMHALASRAAAGSEQRLLSAPTHTGGWIDPEVLVDRLGRASEEIDEADFVLALLRLAPDRRADALTAAAELPGESAAALRYALGSDREQPPSPSAIWVAAARARFPGRDALDLGRKFQKLGSGAARVARPTVTVERTGDEFVWHHLVVAPDEDGRPPSVLYPTVAMHARPSRERRGRGWFWWGANGCGTGAESEADVRWCATLQPSDLDPYFTEGLARIGNNLDWWEARWELRAFLEPLVAVATRLSSIAVRLLTLALAAKEPGIRGLAADATAQALADGRLDPDSLGTALGEAWATPLVTPRRFAVSLASVAAVSAESRRGVREAMTLAFRTTPHADAAQVLELLHELCHADEADVADPEARTTLASYTSGKSGRLARRLLAIEGRPQ